MLGQGDFGSQAIGSTSAAQTLNFSIPVSTTVGSIGILTSGAAALDFADGGSSTCAATTYFSATNCVVNVTFKPAVAGLRSGAVVFFSGAGNTGTVLASVPVYGIGTGPQIAYGPGTAIAIAPTVNGEGLYFPWGVTVDGAGNLFIADYGNGRIIELPPGGGAATANDPIVNGGGLHFPTGVAVDGAGDLFIADTANSRIVEVPAGGGAATAIDPTLNGQALSTPFGVAVDGAGDLFIADTVNSRIVEVPAGGGTPTAIDPTVNGQALNEPHGVAVDGAGDLFIADTVNSRIVEVPAGGGAPTAIDPTVNGESLSYPQGLAVDGAGDLFISDAGNNRIVEMPEGGGAATAIDPTVNGVVLLEPYALAVDAAGDLFIADSGNSRIVELQRSQAPAVNFPTATQVGTSDTTDGAMTVQVQNIGNQALIFTGLSYPTDFPYAGGGANPCTNAISLSAGQECDLDINFTPLSAGSPLSENVTLTDNNLNVAGAQQPIAVGGTATIATVTVTVGTSPVGALFAVDGTPYTTTQTFTWTVGTSHTLIAEANYAIGTVFFTFSAWSDGTPTASDSVVATAGVTSYYAGYNPTALYLSVAPNNAAWGSVTPASAGYYTIGAGTPITATPNPGYYFVNWTGSADIASPTSASTTITMNAPENITANFAPIPILVATTATDDNPGAAANCTPQATPGSNTVDTACSLRDALAFAASAGAANISFASSAGQTFSSAQTITLGSGGTLIVPANTTITGPASGRGSSLANLVTVSGANTFGVFRVNAGAVSIGGLTIANGNDGGGGGIANTGSNLTVINSTFINNTAAEYGGGIVNLGNLTVTNSTFIGNSSGYMGGGLLTFSGTQTVTNSTFAGNSAAYGGGMVNFGGTLTATNSTFTGNTASTEAGGMLNNGGTVNLANSIVSGNISPTGTDVYGGYTDNGGNKITTGVALAPIASYGGPTQTQPPLPGDPSLCGGITANATAAGLTADQRGFVFDPHCPSGAVDSGAVQTNYAMGFASLPAVVLLGQPITPTPTVTLYENGAVATGANGSPVTLSDTGATLSGTLTQNLSSGKASFPGLSFTSLGLHTQLTATMALTSTLNLTARAGSTVTSSPVPATLTAPSSGAILAGPTETFAWTAVAGASGYSLWMGTTGAGSYNLFDSGETAATSVKAAFRPSQGETVYVRLYTIYNGVAQSNDYTFTASVRAAITAPAASSTLASPNVTFTWTAATGASGYSLWLGTSLGAHDLWTSGETAALSVTANGLPTNGSTVYARMYTIYNGVAVSNDYQYTASSLPPASLLTPAPSSVLSGATVTFTWSAATGASGYSLWLGATPGASNLYNSHLTAGLSATATKLPTNGSTIYATLYTNYNGKVKSTTAVYTAAP